MKDCDVVELDIFVYLGIIVTDKCWDSKDIEHTFDHCYELLTRRTQ